MRTINWKVPTSILSEINSKPLIAKSFSSCILTYPSKLLIAGIRPTSKRDYSPLSIMAVLEISSKVMLHTFKQKAELLSGSMF